MSCFCEEPLILFASLSFIKKHMKVSFLYKTIHIITYCKCLDGLTFSSVDHHTPPLLTSFVSCFNLKESSKDLFSICIVAVCFVKFSFICSFCYLFFFAKK